MTDGPQRRRHAVQRNRKKIRDVSAASPVPEQVWSQTAARRTIGLSLLGLLAAGILAGFVLQIGNSDSGGFDEIVVQAVTRLSQADEARVREICSHCHRLPTPDVLPRSAWEDTIWEMFRESGYGTTVKWGVDPSSVVAWYEERAPEQFTFPVTDESREPDGLPLDKRTIASHPSPAPRVVSNILVANVVGDEHPEILVCDMFNGQILMGRTSEPDWHLEPVAEVPNPAHVEAVDLDADGRIDLVVASLGSYLAMDHNLGGVEWLRQREDGTFERSTLADGLGRVADVQPDDFDGDGDLDLVVAEFGWHTTGHLLLLENNTLPGQPAEFDVREIDGLHGASHVDVVDLDGDGLRDIVALYSQGHEMVRCYLQKGKFVFTVHDLYRAPSPTWGFSGSQLLDLDQDNDLDILLTNGDTFDNSLLKPYHGIQWLENQGELQFVPHQLGTLFGAYRAAATDLDGDGDADVVACALIAPSAQGMHLSDRKLDSLVWFEQVAAGEFVRHTLESDQCHHPTLTLSDYDLDGDVDLLVGNGQLHFTVAPSERSCLDLWENKRNPQADAP